MIKAMWEDWLLQRSGGLFLLMGGGPHVHGNPPKNRFGSLGCKVCKAQVLKQSKKISWLGLLVPPLGSAQPYTRGGVFRAWVSKMEFYEQC